MKILLFAGMTGDGLDQLALMAHERRMRRSEVLIRTGDPGQGEVRLQLTGEFG